MDDLYDQLNQYPSQQKYLYRFGYLITDSQTDFHANFPILQSWNGYSCGSYQFWVHPDQALFLCQKEDTTLFLIGHCYDPFSMEWDEQVILKQLADKHSLGHDAYCRRLNDLTGIFVTGWISPSGLTIYTDAAGMLMCYYGYASGYLYLSSHARLLGDLCGLMQSRYVQHLTSYRYYPLFGLMLPGDLSPYSEFKRLLPNHCAHFSGGSIHLERFYPTDEWDALEHQFSLDERTEYITAVLKNTMELIPRKWSRPAISMTGGCDSKTTLACTNGNYTQYQYFSYVSQPSEQLDATGAQQICKHLGLSHSIYKIPETTQNFPLYDLSCKILEYNSGSIGPTKPHEARKRIFLSELDAFDVEVKSWVSEIARAYYCKRFQKEHFPEKPTGRYLTSLYKVFMHDRRLVHETDQIFSRYINAFLSEDKLHRWPWLDLFFWEFRVGAWNGLVITGEHRYVFDITIPYNNRHLLELMLAIPVKLRIEDTLYTKIRELANPNVDQAGVSITNMKHTDRRAKMERAYLEIHSRLPV